MFSVDFARCPTARLSLGALILFGLGSAELASAQTVGRSLVLGPRTGTFLFEGIAAKLCPAAEAETPDTPSGHLPDDPHLDLIRIPDDDGAGGNGAELKPNLWKVVGSTGFSGGRLLNVEPLATCEKSVLATDCGKFAVELHWSATQDVESNLTLIDANGSLFGEVPMKVRMVARKQGDEGGLTIDVVENLRLQVRGTWAPQPGVAAFTANSSWAYDSDCNDSLDSAAPPTATDVFLAWKPGGGLGAVCALGLDHAADVCWAPARIANGGDETD